VGSQSKEVKSLLRGYADMQRKFTRLVNLTMDEGGKALYEEGKIEKTESQKRTPVDTRALRMSHVVHPPTKSKNPQVHITAGGAPAPYGVYVHENLEANHKVGQAKFLESTIRESAPFMAARVAKRIDLKKVMG